MDWNSLESESGCPGFSPFVTVIYQSGWSGPRMNIVFLRTERPSAGLKTTLRTEKHPEKCQNRSSVLLQSFAWNGSKRQTIIQERDRTFCRYAPKPAEEVVKGILSRKRRLGKKSWQSPKQFWARNWKWKWSQKSLPQVWTRWSQILDQIESLLLKTFASVSHTHKPSASH